MQPRPFPSRRIDALQGSRLYRAHERRAREVLSGPVPARLHALARCDSELEAVFVFWWSVGERIASRRSEGQVALLVHHVVHAGGRLCPIDFAFCVVTDDDEVRPGVAVFLDDPTTKRSRVDRTAALERGGWTVLRFARDQVQRDPLGCIAAVRARLSACLAQAEVVS